MNWIETYTGKAVDFADLSKPLNIDPLDIAQGLNGTYRYRSASKVRMSVLEHSVYVASLVDHMILNGHGTTILKEGRRAHVVMAALLHDATEAFMGDVPAPLKRLLPDYQRLERELEGAIRRWAGVTDLTNVEETVIRTADTELLVRESMFLFPDTHQNWGLRQPLEAFDNFFGRCQFGGEQYIVEDFMVMFNSLKYDLEVAKRPNAIGYNRLREVGVVLEKKGWSCSYTCSGSGMKMEAHLAEHGIERAKLTFGLASDDVHGHPVECVLFYPDGNSTGTVVYFPEHETFGMAVGRLLDRIGPTAPPEIKALERGLW